jgi:hypothetical protein
MRTGKNVFVFGLGVATAVIPTAILVLCVNLLFFMPLVIGVAVFCLGLRKSNASAIEWTVFLLVLFAWIGPFLITSYLSRSGPPVEFVVPRGFTGTIEVIEDPNQGEHLRFEHGIFVIEVPTSGVVRLNKTYPFHRWHEEFCRDVDGKPKQLEGQGTTAGGRRTGPNTSESSTDFEGTSYRWDVR